MPHVTERTSFVVQYELYTMPRGSKQLHVEWTDSSSHDNYEAAVWAMRSDLSKHASPMVMYKYGEHRIVRRTTTIVDDPLYFPQADEDTDRVTLATPVEALRGKVSTRLLNVLLSWTPHTHTSPLLLAHVVMFDAHYWLEQPNMGRISLAELHAFLRNNDLPELGTLPIAERGIEP